MARKYPESRRLLSSGAVAALIVSLLFALTLTLSYSRRYLEFVATFPATSWLHLYPSIRGEAGPFSYKGVRAESNGRPVTVRLPLPHLQFDALLLRVNRPGGVVALRDIRIVNGRGDTIVAIEQDRLENSGASTRENVPGGVDLAPNGLSDIIDMRLNLDRFVGLVPQGVAVYLLKMFSLGMMVTTPLLAVLWYMFRPWGVKRGEFTESLSVGRGEETPRSLAWSTAGVFMIILGARLWLVHTFGSDLPYWDQWDGEASSLYIPYLKGTLSPQDLFAPHNEHRILLARLASLALLLLNGTWDPLLQMTVNALIYAAVGTFVYRFLAEQAQLPWGVAVALVFSLPFGWQNTLGGFQLPIYLLVGVSLLFLWLMTCVTSSGWKWCGGILCVLLFPFTMASGFLACAALTLLLLMNQCRRGETGRMVPAALLLCLGGIIAGMLLKVDVAAHANLKAASLMDFLIASVAYLGWPLTLFSLVGGGIFGGWGALLGAVLLLWLPFMVLAGKYLRHGKSDCRVSLLMGVGLWILLQVAASAYARGKLLIPPSRYQDIFALGLLVNCAALLYVREGDRGWLPGWAGRTLAILWVMGVLCGLVRVTEMNCVYDLPEKRTQQQASLEHLREFMASGKMSALEGKPKFDLPYPDHTKLALLLNNPDLRRVLPASLTGGVEKGRMRPLVDAFLKGSLPLAAAGAACFLFSLWNRTVRVRPSGNTEESGVAPPPGEDRSGGEA
jgi:hypothetical protein